MMRILVVNEFIGDMGGAESYTAAICEELTRRGLDVHLAYDSQIGHGIPKVPSTLINGNVLAHPQGFQTISPRPLLDLVDRLQPDLAYIQNVLNPEGVREISRKVPTVRFLHDHRLFCPECKILGNTLQPCEKPFGFSCLFYTAWYGCMGRNPRGILTAMRVTPRAIAANKNLKAIIVASDYMKSCLVTQGFDEDQLRVNPLFSRFPADSGQEPRKPCLLYVGQLSRRKGVPGLLKIVDRLPDSVRLILAGETPTREDKRAVMKALSSLSSPHRVTLAGWQSDDDLLRLYRTSFALVMPSLGQEPFGLAGMEALSQATPVIAFDAGGLGEWLRTTGGAKVIASGDWPGLVQVVKCLFEETDLRKKMGRQGQSFVEREMTLHRHVDRLEEVFQIYARS